MPLTWNDALATGVRQIDLQHQELIELINALEAAHAAGRREDALKEELPKLNAYVLFHFGTEESLMPVTNPDHVSAHRRQHAEFSGRIAALRQEPMESIDLPELIAYLNRWLIEHIMKTDRELGKLIRAQGNAG